jgi:hypothetical protein
MRGGISVKPSPRREPSRRQRHAPEAPTIPPAPGSAGAARARVRAASPLPRGTLGDTSHGAGSTSTLRGQSTRSDFNHQPVRATDLNYAGHPASEIV